LYRFLAITVLLDVKDIPQVGPLQRGRITPAITLLSPAITCYPPCHNKPRPVPADDICNDNCCPDLVGPRRSGRPPPRPQTMLTVLTQTPPFVSGNCACEPGCTGVGALGTIPQPPRPKRLVFVPVLVLAGAPIGALPTSCRRLLGEGFAKTVLSKLLKEIADRAAGAAWSSAMSRAAHRSAVPVGAGDDGQDGTPPE
jgi:hypothetical protein